MKKAVLILVVIAILGAIGANPRYLEELRLGGGFGDTQDGGADFEKDGTIRTDGTVLPAAVDLPDGTETLLFGTDDDIRVGYDEAGEDRLEWSDGANLLMSLSDTGTAGDLQVTGGLRSALGLDTLATGTWTLGSTTPSTVRFGAASGGNFDWRTNAVSRMELTENQLRPATDKALTLGSASTRWGTIWGDNGEFSGDLNLTNSTGPTITATVAGQDLVLTTASGDIFLDDNVGIGTASPETTLDVRGDVQFPLYVVRTTTSANDQLVSINLRENDSAGSLQDTAFIGAAWSDNTAGSADSYIAFGTKNADSLAERMRLDTDGKLTVLGDVAINGGDLSFDDTTINIAVGVPTTINIGDSAATVSIDGLIGFGNISYPGANTEGIWKQSDVGVVIQGVGAGDDIYLAGRSGGRALAVPANTINLRSDGDFALNGGDLTSTSTTFNLLVGDPTTINIGDSGATVFIPGDLSLSNATDPTITATVAQQDLVLTTTSGQVVIDDDLKINDHIRLEETETVDDGSPDITGVNFLVFDPTTNLTVTNFDGVTIGGEVLRVVNIDAVNTVTFTETASIRLNGATTLVLGQFEGATFVNVTIDSVFTWCQVG